MTNVRLLSTVEAAEVLEVGTRTVTRLANEGVLPTEAKGAGIRGPRFFKEADVRLLKANRDAKRVPVST